jgi:uncharacterized membrane protein
MMLDALSTGSRHFPSPMELDAREWLHIVLRWSHVFAGILWIGSTYFFTWLDHRLHDPKEGGQVWMVHSGGFYVVEKQTAPELTRALHWFRWEAALTWLTGALLLGLVYHAGGALVNKEVLDISVGTASGLCVGLLIVAWLIYDFLWSSPLGKNELVGAAICYTLAVAIAYGLTKVLASRAAYIYVGAMFGTIMAANVWLRILPAQRRLVAAVRGGAAPDTALAVRAKTRSKHNTFMVVPVVFMMISNHFPTATYGSDHNWVVLAVLILVGFGAAKILRR